MLVLSRWPCLFPHTHFESRPKLSSASLRARCRPCVHARSAFQSLDCSSAWQSLSRVSLSSFHLPVPFRPLPKTCGDLSTAAACYPPRTSVFELRSFNFRGGRAGRGTGVTVCSFLAWSRLPGLSEKAIPSPQCVSSLFLPRSVGVPARPVPGGKR